MKNGRFWFGILFGMILSALIGFLLLPNLGVFPVSATGKPNILDWWGHTNLESFLDRQAPESMIPDSADRGEGFEHYLAMCLHCHGGPDASRQKWAEHMLPKPPDLWEEEVQQERTDAELFYIIANGIRMTGMPAFGPTHGRNDIWNIVAFLRQLDRLTDEQKHEMRHTSSAFQHGGGENHHGGNSGHDEGGTH